MSAFSDTDDWFSDDLDSFVKSGKPLQIATPAKDTTIDSQCNFLSFLGIAQSLNIDFLPITWQPALDNIGQGGTAKIHQALVNLQTSFAFKRLTPTVSVQPETGETRNFRALIAEISVLSHPSVRDHPNIIRLEGICWDVVSGGEKVWPVLVFEKARHGDLHTFMGQAEGKRLTVGERLNICADIAIAVMDMHSSSIIHGDIKPTNILVFENDSNGYVAKAADFGYSTWFARDNELVKMPRSPYWVAPEWHHRGFKAADAMKMDIYSFGMLCLWLLFYNTQENTTRDFYSNLNSAKTVLVLAHQLIIAMAGLDDQERCNLNQLFDLTLANNPVDRSLDFNQLIRLFAPHRAPALRPLALFTSSSHSLYNDFQVTPSVYQLYWAQYEVRAYIAACLKNRATGSSPALVSQNAAFELAFCYKLGFGIPKDDDKSESLLNQSMRRYEELEYKINHIKRGDLSLSFQEGTYRRLETQGHITRIRFAQYYREQQRLDKAELEYRREIADTKIVLGAEHEIVLYQKSQLSSIVETQGRWEEAEELDVQIVETRKRVLGAEHPDTLASIVNLALTYGNQGRWKEAEELVVRVLETGKMVLGVEHLDTLATMENLASTYSNQGRWKEAEELEVQVMQTRLKVLGAEHLDTLSSIGNLASTYRNQGRWKEAEYLNVQVIERGKRVLGAEHPDTLASMGNLASTFWNQGRWKEAEELFVQVTETSLRVLGAEHPDTLTSMANLASTYRNQGRWKEAEELFVQVIETRKRELGEEHPSTLTSMANLAATYRNQGRWKEAEELNVQVLEARKRVLGVEHPDTLTSMGNLASTFWNQGRCKEAEELFVQVMETRKRELGEEHPSTLTSMNNLARTYHLEGRNDEAIELMEHAVMLLTRIFGASHPNTLNAASALSAWKST